MSIYIYTFIYICVYSHIYIYTCTYLCKYDIYIYICMHRNDEAWTVEPGAKIGVESNEPAILPKNCGWIEAKATASFLCIEDSKSQ